MERFALFLTGAITTRWRLSFIVIKIYAGTHAMQYERMNGVGKKKVTKTSVAYHVANKNTHQKDKKQNKGTMLLL